MHLKQGLTDFLKDTVTIKHHEAPFTYDQMGPLSGKPRQTLQFKGIKQFSVREVDVYNLDRRPLVLVLPVGVLVILPRRPLVLVLNGWLRFGGGMANAIVGSLVLIGVAALFVVVLAHAQLRWWNLFDDLALGLMVALFAESDAGGAAAGGIVGSQAGEALDKAIESAIGEAAAETFGKMMNALNLASKIARLVSFYGDTEVSVTPDESTVHKRLGDPFIETLTVLTIPYAAYMVAEALHVSGVLAVVAAGLVRGRYAPEMRRAVRLVAGGQTPKAVSEAAGVCPRTVRKWVQRNGGGVSAIWVRVGRSCC